MSQNHGETICSGVRGCVGWLTAHGFRTIDSGDGSHHAAGMECAWEVSQVIIETAPDKMVEESKRLWDLVQAQLNRAGLELKRPDPMSPLLPAVEASYSPSDGLAFLVLLGSDETLGLTGWPEEGAKTDGPGS